MATDKTLTTYPTEEMIEAGAKAAWVAYKGRDGSDTWPETMLYPKADDFRKCAKACFIAMMEIGHPDEEWKTVKY